MKYSKGCKSSIVRRVVEDRTKSVYQVAKETGISGTTIKSWLEMHKVGTLTLASTDELSPSQSMWRVFPGIKADRSTSEKATWNRFSTNRHTTRPFPPFKPECVLRTGDLGEGFIDTFMFSLNRSCLY